MLENGVEQDVQVLDWTLGGVESSLGWTGNKNKFPKLLLADRTCQ